MTQLYTVQPFALWVAVSALSQNQKGVEAEELSWSTVEIKRYDLLLREPRGIQAGLQKGDWVLGEHEVSSVEI